MAKAYLVGSGIASLPAVATLLNLDTQPKPVFKGQHNPKTLIDALHTLHRR